MAQHGFDGKSFRVKGLGVPFLLRLLWGLLPLCGGAGPISPAPNPERSTQPQRQTLRTSPCEHSACQRPGKGDFKSKQTMNLASLR
jgi:hypothetical protein